MTNKRESLEDTRRDLLRRKPKLVFTIEKPINLVKPSWWMYLLHILRIKRSSTVVEYVRMYSFVRSMVKGFVKSIGKDNGGKPK